MNVRSFFWLSCNTGKMYEEAYFGQLPPDVGGTLLNLGMAYARIYDRNKAEPLYLR